MNFKVGDTARLHIIDKSHAGSYCLGRDGSLVTVTDVGNYYESGDNLFLMIKFPDGRESGTHAMNLDMAHGPCPMEAHNV